METAQRGSNALSRAEAGTGCFRSVWMTQARSCRRHYPGGGISEPGSPPPSAPRQTGRKTARPSGPPAPDPAELARLADTPPIMTGAEYLSTEVLASLWRSMGQALDAELAESRCPLQEFLKRRNPAWNLVGRVHFNLAENRQDPEAPFAFLATYTPRLSAQAKAQHLPLGKALKEYAGAANKDGLLSLLTPVQTAAASCPWLKAMVDEGEIYYPCAGRRRRRCSSSTMSRPWKAPAWWCARPRIGA